MAKKDSKVFAVFGLGVFGQTLAQVLSERGGQVIAVSNDPDAVDGIKNQVEAALLIDSTDEKAMDKAPLDDVDTAVVTIEGIEPSIITTALLKKRGIPYIICRAMTKIHGQILRQIGANEIVNLQEDEGKRIGARLITPEVLETIPLSSDTSIGEFYLPELFYDNPLSALALEEKFGLRVVGIKRISVELDSEGNPVRNEKFFYPKDSDLLRENDLLVLVGKNFSLDNFKNSL